MSGGHFEYKQHHIIDITDKIEHLIQSNTEKDEWGCSRNYSPETIEKFRDAVKQLKLAVLMAQRIDGLVSGDRGEESFHRRWEEDLEEFLGSVP